MKVGLSSYSLARAVKGGEMDIFGVLRFAAENGAEHVEIVPGAFGELTGNDEFIAKIVKSAKENNLALSSYTIGANFVQPTPEATRKEVERIKREVETAAKLGVTRMRHDCGWRAPEECSYANFDKDIELFADICGEIADTAKAYGITTSVENHGFYVQASERVQRLVLKVNRDNFRTTLDVGNFLCVDEDPECATLNNIGIASMVHFKDFHIRREVPNPEEYIKTAHGRYIRGAITGDGDVNLAGIVKIMKAAKYDGFLSIEYEGWDECKSACARALKNVKALVANN